MGMEDCILPWSYRVPEGSSSGQTPLRSEYDTEALKERAIAWRAEALAVASAEMRAFCLAEAEKCELRIRRSLTTPLFRVWDANGAWVPQNR
jgi:hypothetical protein